MITFIIGLLIGYVIAMFRFTMALRNKPSQFLDIIKNNAIHELTKDKKSYKVYIEEENGKFFAYSIVKNTYECMADSEDELIEKLCMKYPSHNIVIVEDD